jgi:hypothetical protein
LQNLAADEAGRTCKYNTHQQPHIQRRSSTASVSSVIVCKSRHVHDQKPRFATPPAVHKSVQNEG